MKPISSHWADQAATRIVGQRGDRDRYVVASGITPSGTVHIGNFREVITVDLVARALRKAGKQVRFIYSWDDFDTFRKVPANVPDVAAMEPHLREPISRIPDPWGEAGTYAQRNIKKFEEELSHMGIEVEFIYQQEKYAAGTYAEGMRKALEAKDQIRKILDQHRSSPLPDTWLPTAIYCEKCGKDDMQSESYPGEWDYSYECASCGHAATTDIRTTKNLKLNWRTDWPMRWEFEKVDFEPGGKDHSSDGGSFDTGKDIVRDVYGWEPPIYLQYDFVMIKGGAGKMSSSSGKLFDLSQVMAVYSPEMIRWIFARQKPNVDFSIAFDEDVIKLHDEFDRMEQQAVAAGPEASGKALLARRVYELSLVDGKAPEVAPYRAPFRELCNRLQICDGDAERTLSRYYGEEVKTPADRAAFAERAQRAWTWINEHAPEDFKYRINASRPSVELPDQHQDAVAKLRSLVETTNLETIDPKELNQAIYDDVIRATGVEAKPFFQNVYQLLICRDRGPRLPSFLKEIGKERLLQLL